MPCGLKGNTTLNIDGSYTVLINARLSVETQQKVYIHELKHIVNGDFDGSNADEIELVSHTLKRGLLYDALCNI